MNGRFTISQEKVLLLLGKEKAEQVWAKTSIDMLSQVEFRIFSQYGEDGIIQYLISKIDIPHKVFIEFGVENYLESNTRFLLINNNWSGLVIDGSPSNIRFIRKDPISWRQDVTAVQAFITRTNINELISRYAAPEDIGLLSIDIDGNDYWILKEIDTVKPRILVCEYNNVFGADHAVTVPYQENFIRRKAHYSDLYFGASLKAIYQLARDKGYDLVGVNSAGINAFFVRKDLSGPFRKFTPEEIYFPSNIRESRNKKGELNFLKGDQRIGEIKMMKVFHVDKQADILIKDLFGI